MNVALRLGVSVVLIAAFLWIIGSSDVLTRLRGATPGWVLAAILFLVVQTVLMALRWRLVARTLGIRFSRRWAIGEYFVAQMINYTLPGGVVGDGARAVRSKQGADGLKRAAQAVVIERAIGQLGLYIVLAAGLIWATVATGPLTLRPGVAALGTIVLLVVTLIGAGAFFVFRTGRIVALMARCLPNRRVRSRHIVLSIAAALMNVAAFTCCALAVGVSLPAGAILVVVPLILSR